MSIIKNYRLRLDAGNITPLIIHVNQYDKNEIWNFTLIDYQGNQYITTEAAIVGKKPDGCLIVNNCTVSEGIVSVEVTEQMTAAAGKAVFELLIDGQVHGTANFIVMIERSPKDGAIESESDLSLFQRAIDATSTPAIIAGVQAWMDENLTPTTPVVDSSLSITGAAADAKKTGDEISELKSQISANQGLTDEFKEALENFAKAVAFKDTNGQTYINALHTAMYPPANLTRISAVYTQNGTVYNTASLDSLKTDLVVTAHYSDSTTAVVNTYALSGTLVEGTSTITVTYGGKTTTFTVYVTVKSNTELELYVPTSVSRGKTFDTTNGEEVSAGEASAITDDYIPVNNKTTIVYKNAPSGKEVWTVVVYDNSKNYLEQIRVNFNPSTNPNMLGISITNPAAAYVRIYWYVANSTTFVGEFYFASNYKNLEAGIGDINSTTGEINTSVTYRAHTDFIPASGTITVAGCPFGRSWSGWTSNSGFGVRCYDSAKQYLGYVDVGGMSKKDLNDVSLLENTAYVCLVFQKNTGAFPSISTEAIYSFAVNDTAYFLTEEQ